MGFPRGPGEDRVATWKKRDLLEGRFRWRERNGFEHGGGFPVSPGDAAAACLPYSPGVRADQPGRGAATLAQIATTTADANGLRSKNVE